MGSPLERARLKRLDVASTDDILQFRHFVHLVNIDPAKNRFRFYILLWQPDLWGHLSLVRRWGRIGTQGRTADIPYSDRLSAQGSVRKVIRRRLQHGYQILAWR
ncbi:MAG: WGR domain-containing protein [Chloroflexi bacterium]|nr:WGR domain-containing protein [Chloroflexota bacterium]